MPKSKINKDKKKKVKLSDMSMKERDQIKDVDLRMKVAKEQEKKRGRTVTAEQLAREEAAKQGAPIKGVKVKVGSTPKQQASQSTEQPKPQGVKIKEQYKDSFGHKMTREEVQETYFKRTLDPLREQLAVLTQKANEMVASETDKNSRAYAEATRSLNKAGREHLEQTGELFNPNQKSAKGINREISRVMSFLTDYTSTLEGGLAEKEHDRGLFGGQWRKMGYAGYDEQNVSKADADMVFDIYHRLLEQEGGWQRVMGYFKAVNPGIIEYGSEQLINSIYDMVLNKNEFEPEPGMDAEGAILARAIDLVETMISSYMQLAVLQRSGADYGNVEDDPEGAERRRRVYEWQLAREKYRKDE